ncbi:MAG TPA: M61 family peptidase [Phenylobacterium sp.]|jgi:predicted metalloprotease with PDZ domain|nr:M61 family peptidase [Phenylobacterium sp.]
MRDLVLALTGALLLAGTASAKPAVQDPGPNGPIQYEVSFDNARHHEARITVTYRDVKPGPFKLQMARSSPGRYAVHEFAKNVYNLSAEDGAAHPLKIERTEPYSWTVVGHSGTVKATYTLYGDFGDGTYAQIDATHAHLNMPAVFMWSAGYEQRPIRVRFHPFDPSWKVATQLPASSEPDTFWAPNFKYFMDSPTELSDFMLREWTVQDHGHSYAFRLAIHHTGTAEDADRFAEKLKKLIPQETAVFGELPHFDFGTYTFIADYMPQVSGDGMEHRNSTFMTVPRSLQRADFGQLSTASHEFFHAWNVRRIRPVELEPFDFTRADPSPSLWEAEGFTNYYGPLIIRRSGQSTVDEFLASMSGPVSFLVTAPNRTYGSPKEMSLRAPFLDAAVSIDKTNRNTTVSYYAYGQVLALALDLELRERFKGLTLDDYMRRLWTTFGAPEKPYTARDLRETLVAVTGDAKFANDFFDKYVDGNGLPNFEPLVAQAGLKLRQKSPDRPWLGSVRVRAEGPELFLDSAPALGTPLYVAGVDSGDRILTLGKLEIADEADWTTAISRLKPGDRAPIRFVQRGKTTEATLTVAADPTLEIVRAETAGGKPTEAELAFRQRWLGPDSEPQKAAP